MEVHIKNSKATSIAFPKRIGRTSAHEDFSASKGKKLFLQEESVSIDGKSGEVVIKARCPEKIVEHIRNGSLSIDGTYFYAEENEEIERMLNVCDQITFGTQDVSKVDIHTLLAADRIELPEDGFSPLHTV